MTSYKRHRKPRPDDGPAVVTAEPDVWIEPERLDLDTLQDVRESELSLNTVRREMSPEEEKIARTFSHALSVNSVGLDDVERDVRLLRLRAQDAYVLVLTTQRDDEATDEPEPPLVTEVALSQDALDLLAKLLLLYKAEELEDGVILNPDTPQKQTE